MMEERYENLYFISCNCGIIFMFWVINKVSLIFLRNDVESRMSAAYYYAVFE